MTAASALLSNSTQQLRKVQPSGIRPKLGWRRGAIKMSAAKKAKLQIPSRRSDVQSTSITSSSRALTPQQEQRQTQQSYTLWDYAELDTTSEQRQLLLFLALSTGFAGVTEMADAADMQALADLSLQLDRGQVITFFVNNPFITLGTAVAAYFILPRLINTAVKFVLVPLAIGGAAYLVVTNPSTSFAVAKTTFGYIAANPIVVSVAVLVALALTLSPYVLVAGGLFLVFSAVSLPGPLKRLLPAPVVEADRQLDVVRQQVKGPVNSLKDSFFGSKNKALAPAYLDASRLLPAPQLAAEIQDQQQQ